MSYALLERLRTAQTDEERAWIITESLIDTLSPELQSAVWAAAIPHWFDAEILAALRPELQAQAADFYAQLQTLSFVEVFAERGHNIHERTRKLMLERLWQQNQDEFALLSARAATFFEQNDSSSAVQIEWLYHLVVADREWQNSDLWNFLALEWWNNFRQAELESLIQTLLEQVEAYRTTILATAEIYFWSGQTRFRFDQFVAALSQYQQALELFRIVRDHFGEANTLQMIGDVLLFQNCNEEALGQYQQALELFLIIGDPLGQANTLQAIGDVLRFQNLNEEALGQYEQALELFHMVGNRFGEANTLQVIGDVLLFQNRNEEALSQYEQALELFRIIGDRFGEANTLQAIGHVLGVQKRNEEALGQYQQALELFHIVGDSIGEANTLQGMGFLQEDLRQGLEYFLNALEIYTQINDKYSQSRHLITTLEIFVKLGRQEEVIEFLYRGVELAKENSSSRLVEYGEAKLKEITGN